MILSETLEKRAHRSRYRGYSEAMEKIEKNIQTIGHHLKERLFEMNGLS
jgi:hypothetical protein